MISLVVSTKRRAGKDEQIKDFQLTISFSSSEVFSNWDGLCLERHSEETVV